MTGGSDKGGERKDEARRGVNKPDTTTNAIKPTTRPGNYGQLSMYLAPRSHRLWTVLSSLDESLEGWTLCRVPAYFQQQSGTMAKKRNVGPGEVRLRIEAILDPSLTCAEIARRCGCNDTYVNTVARINGITLATSTVLPHAVNGRWSDELVDTLRKLVAEGLTCGQIAERMGGFTRNAIIGKIHRCKLEIPQRIKVAIPKPIAIGAPEPRKGSRASPAPRINPDYDMPAPAPTDVARKQLRDLMRDDCKFPVGDPGERGFGFCASERIPGSPYCQTHHSRCFAGIPVKAGQKDPANDERVDA